MEEDFLCLDRGKCEPSDRQMFPVKSVRKDAQTEKQGSQGKNGKRERLSILMDQGGKREREKEKGDTIGMGVGNG